MSKRNYVVDTKTLAKIEKDAEQVKKLRQQIADAYAKIDAIYQDSRWLSYLGESSTATLTEEQRADLYEYTDTIKYGNRNII